MREKVRVWRVVKGTAMVPVKVVKVDVVRTVVACRKKAVVTRVTHTPVVFWSRMKELRRTEEVKEAMLMRERGVFW